MNKQKVGLALFWIAIFWALGWGMVGSAICGSFLKTMTLEEVNMTAWALNGTLMFVWGVLGVPIAAILGGTGLLIYAGSKNSFILRYIIGITVVLILAIFSGFIGHIPLLFGLGGLLILLCFFGITWYWAQKRVNLKDKSAAAADLQLTGYTFFLIAAWFTCGGLSQPFFKALEENKAGTPLHIMIFVVLGWIFLFLSHYKTRNQD